MHTFFMADAATAVRSPFIPFVSCINIVYFCCDSIKEEYRLSHFSISVSSYADNAFFILIYDMWNLFAGIDLLDKEKVII